MLKYLDWWLMSALQKHHTLSKELGDLHPKTVAAAKLVEEEYALCLLQEENFIQSLNRLPWSLKWVSSKWVSSAEALRLAEAICEDMNSPNIQGFGDNQHKPWSGAYYDRRTQRIHCDFPLRIDFFLHELTHHIQSHIDFWEPFRKMHGEKFCEVELRVFDIVLKGARNE